MNFFGVLTLLGGLALFLFGMDYMGNSLTSWSGSNLKSILGRMTSNRFKAVGLGAAVTAIIQSSSGTTVMVVGLVNSGIMTLKQAIGVIMGANIGTTITTWILSLTGINTPNVFIELLKPTSFAPILAVIGVCFLLFVKNDRKQNLAGVFVGFAILIFGMETMSHAMQPLAQDPGFQQLFVSFKNPILGILAGAILTAVIQSSSASVGILQALSASGIVSMAAAIPIIMGQNIGTCITAALSALNAQRNAKRAAAVHLLINISGSVFFTILIYLGRSFIAMPFLDTAVSPVSIAMIHTAFNVLNVAILIHLIPLLERIAYAFIPENDDERQAKRDDFQALDERLLDTPSIALAQCRTLTSAMFAKARELVVTAETLITAYDANTFKRLKRLENLVDRYEDNLGTYMLKLSALKLNDADNRSLTAMLHSIGDFERIADHGWTIALAAKELSDKRTHFSRRAVDELTLVMNALSDILTLTYEAFEQRDLTRATRVEALEEAIDVLTSELKQRHIQRLKAGVCSIDLGFVWSDVLTSIERISDHCSNVAVLLLELASNQMDAHQRLHRIKKKSNVSFQSEVDTCLSHYPLPEEGEHFPWPELLEPASTEPQSRDIVVLDNDHAISPERRA